MRKTLLLILCAGMGIFIGWTIYQANTFKGQARPALLKAEKENEKREEADEQDGILLAQQQEFAMTHDIKLGYIPKYRLVNAYNSLMAERRRQIHANGRLTNTSGLTWQERGPNTDAIGPSNGNTRAGNAVTSGRMRAILVDMADLTGKTVWVGGVDGGLWKTDNITASPASWTLINDFFGNLAIASICQDPANNDIMYFGTGEKTYNLDAVRGGGIWKSTDHGVTWNLLPATTGFWNVSKMACDVLGNVYVATIGNGGGILRSADGGNTWTNITPSGLSSRVTEMKISSTGRMHIVCGYYNTPPSSAGYRYTDNPATVTSGTWTAPVTSFTPVGNNCEIACVGNTLYVINADANFQTPQIFKSVDGGANWSPTPTSPPAASGTFDLSSGQGWYCIAIGADPANPNNVIVGSLNCYRSTNGGSTWSRISGWVGTTGNYVHADQHIVTWNGNQVLIGSDGGIFYSADGGTTFSDRNAGLRLKQFYSCAIHPTSTNYFLGGTQDNGTHQLNSSGLGGSIEVTGGDGAFAHIDQDQPQYQFGAYVFSNYRRSTNGGNTWSGVDLGNIGRFINPTDYDDINNRMYTAGNAGQYIRWEDPQTGNTFTPVSVPAIGTGSVTHVTVSSYTPNRVFFGTSDGKVIKIDNANTNSPASTDIRGSSMSASGVSCIAAGTDDDQLIATFSNYGAAHVWVTNTGGGATGWTNISGNLPDIPVRWAMFYPDDNTQAIIATDMGIYTTTAINGAATIWTQDPGFPVVRTDMLQYRKSDRTLLAATHGRGLWTATIAATDPYIRYAYAYTTQAETTSGTSGCRGYKDYTVNLTIDMPPTGDAIVTVQVAGGATATEGIDYDFTTNGNFTSPSKTVTFSNGSSTSKTVTVRVYDDASIENTESFTLNYTVSGTTNAKAAPGSSSTYTFYITDNDAAPVPPQSITNFAIGSYTNDLTWASAFCSNKQKHRLQVLFKASELTAAGMTAGSISALTMRVVTKNSTKPYTGFTVSIGSTSATNLYYGFVGASLTQVYTADYTSVAGDNTFAFGTGAGSASSFVWNGVSNIIVQFCFDNSSAAADAAADVMEGSNPFGTNWDAQNIASTYSNGGNGSGCSLPSAYIDYPRVNVTFTRGIPNPVVTALNATKTAYLGPNNDVYFYNTNGHIMAHIRSLSSFDYGCATVTVDRAGDGATAFWDNNTAHYLANKTFHVVPAANNSAGEYQITLYFTAAEKAAWEAATGQSWSNIQIVKVDGQINQVTPAAPNGAGNVYVFTPVLGTYGSDYTVTYTFTNGFSGFGVGIPGTNPLPLTLLNFDGRLYNNTVLLEWSTSSEHNSDYFEVQKSLNGSDFYKLQSVPAAGNSTTKRNYHFTDRQVNEVNYYRLKMTDLNGRYFFSQTVVIKNPHVQQNVWVVNNPFGSFIDLRFAITPQQKIRFELTDIKGARVYYKEPGITNPLRLDLSAVQLPAGTYILRTMVDNKLFTNKVIKQ